MAAAGGTTAYTWSATGLPGGLTIDAATGAISGTPGSASSGTVNVTVTDSTLPTHQTVTKPFTLTIGTGLSITTASLPAGIAGSAYSATVAAAGGTTAYTWSATGLPSGLAIDAATGVISGTPAATSSGTVNVTVTDSTLPTHLTVTKPFTLTVGAGLSITTATLPGGVAGSAYSATVAAAGGTTAYTWSATGLPSGLAIDAATGVISGTPAAASSGTVNVTVTDSTLPTHLTVTKPFTLTIGAALSITTATLPAGFTGTAYTATVAAVGGTQPYAWSATGLPNGLAIDGASGVISGTPTVTFNGPVTVTATDATNPTHQSVNKQLTLVVAAPLVISTASLPQGPANRSIPPRWRLPAGPRHTRGRRPGCRAA